MVTKRVRVPTPAPCPPDTLLESLAKLTAPLPDHDRISVGFPGVVRDGQYHYGTAVPDKAWLGFPLEDAISQRLGKPARLLNDAEVQGLGIITGQGLEVVLTLGTGVGSAMFSNGAPTPHLELAHHPIRKDKTYNDYVGNAAYRAISKRKWNKRVLKMIDIVYALVHYDVLYFGGGNAANIDVAAAGQRPYLVQQRRHHGWHPAVGRGRLERRPPTTPCRRCIEPVGRASRDQTPPGPLQPGDWPVLGIGQGGQTDAVGLCRIGVKNVGQLAHADADAHGDGYLVDHLARPRGHDGCAQDPVGPGLDVDIDEAVVLSVGYGAVDILHHHRVALDRDGPFAGVPTCMPTWAISGSQ